MTEQRLRQLLDRFPSLDLAVIGDFFLDKYLIIDPALSEISLETGLEAYQVVAKRPQPGAAGTVTNNLTALGVGTVRAIGVIGDDGDGYELQKSLAGTGVRTDLLVETPERFTPTYTKPMVLEPDGSQRELNRQDIKNRTPLPPELEGAVIANLRAAAETASGVIVADQVQERNCGVITDRVRAALADLAAAHPDIVFFADSRVRIGEFRNVIVKPNRREAIAAVYPDREGPEDAELTAQCAQALTQRTGRPVFLTLGDQGILVVGDAGAEHVAAVPVEGPIDIVGAGDSTTAGIVCALCSGAELAEAALVATLVASITIQQLGTTGTASPEQVLARLRRSV